MSETEKETNGERRKSSFDKEKLAKLQQLKFGIASKFLERKGATALTAEESAVAAISLSKVMARKKGAEISMQVEIENDAHWKLLLRKEGLAVVEVYAGWCGPCLSMAGILKKVKVDANDDRLTLAIANSDCITDLRIFRGQSEPAWVFLGGGKPVKLLRGANASALAEAIKCEFQHELLCMDGKAKRNLISINDEAERRYRAQSEAVHLVNAKRKAELKALKEAEIAIIEQPSKQASVSPEPMNEDDENNNGENEGSLVPSDAEDEKEKGDEENAEELSLSKEEDEQTKEVSEMLDPVGDEINARLTSALDAFTVLAIQGFLLETGAVTEIKDRLRTEFRLVQQRYITLDETGVRKLFGIPYEIDELIEEEEKEEEGNDDADKASEKSEAVGDSISVAGKSEGDPGDSSATEIAETIEEKAPEPKYRKVPIPLPKDLVGDTLLFLLESLEIVKLREQDPEAGLAKNADDYLRFILGPQSYQEAKDNEPKSLLAIYGREEYAVGVWCPPQYEDKKNVMLCFFPQFVIDPLLLPPPKEAPKYLLFLFPALFSNEIMEHEELVTHKNDIIAQGKMNLPSRLVDRMLGSRDVVGEDFEAQKRTLLAYDMFAISIDEKNDLLSQTLASLEPIHQSVNNENGRFETAKLFPYLNILIDNDYDDELIRRDLIVERFLARGPKLKMNAIFGDEDEEFEQKE